MSGAAAAEDDWALPSSVLAWLPTPSLLWEMHLIDLSSLHGYMP